VEEYGGKGVVPVGKNVRFDVNDVTNDALDGISTAFNLGRNSADDGPASAIELECLPMNTRVWSDAYRWGCHFVHAWTIAVKPFLTTL
jgi:hypothetical protein